MLVDEAVQAGGSRHVRYHLWLNVVAMGDHNTVDIVQVVQEGALQKGGCLVADTVLRYDSPVSFLRS